MSIAHQMHRGIGVEAKIWIQFSPSLSLQMQQLESLPSRSLAKRPQELGQRRSNHGRHHCDHSCRGTWCNPKTELAKATGNKKGW
jgi:hypothetical protein